MFGLFKKLFRRGGDEPQAAPPASPAAPQGPQTPRTRPFPAATAPASGPPPGAALAPTPARSQPERAGTITAGGDVIKIPLTALLKRLPEAVAQRATRSPQSGDALTLSVGTVLEQMPRGEVKISYAELRRGSPPGMFSELSPDDRLAISLPLEIVVPLLKAEHLARRPDQRKRALAGDVNPVFAVPANAPQERVEIRGLASEQEAETPAAIPASSLAPSKAPVPRTAPPAMPAPFPTPAAIKPSLPGPVPVAGKPTALSSPAAVPSPPSQAHASQPAPVPLTPPPAPESPIRFTPPPQAASAFRPAAAPSAKGPAGLAPGAPAKPASLPVTIARPAPMPGTAPLPGPVARTVPPNPALAGSPAPAAIPRLRLTPQETPAIENATAAPAASAPPTAALSGPVAPSPSPDRVATPSTAAEIGVVRAAIWALMIAWPEALRAELGQKGLAQRVVAFPGSALDPGIKTGRVSFPWETLQAWIEPPLAPGEVPYAGSAHLPIPLQVVAPLFMALRRPAAQRKVQIPDTIPDLFAGRQTVVAAASPPGSPPTESVAAMPEVPLKETSPPPPARSLVAPPASSLAAPFPSGVAPRLVAPPAAPAPAGVASALDLAVLFGQPGKLHWTPVELVQNTCRLPGVAGTLIALADGLQVASQLPGGFDADTLAAFLPQIFARVAHYTNEIKLGEPSVVSFTANHQVWQIIKAGRVFLLAVGQVGETLPSAQLNAVASQLERQSRTN